jgi:hypothetical protein
MPDIGLIFETANRAGPYLYLNPARTVGKDEHLSSTNRLGMVCLAIAVLAGFDDEVRTRRLAAAIVKAGT